ncbi:MAG TPA: hypothetical protein VJ798_03050, partial [Rhizomicrobium sp.]|nr:hypothetical protein [Rhizomicrobium sp.]
MTDASKVFTIGASANFAASLARGLMTRLGADPLALAAVTIYLPTRRAARNFGDAFARELGGAALLPQFRALGDADEDDLLFDADDITLKPAIAPLRRQLLLAHLVRRWHVAHRGGAIGFAQAASLAARLAGVMDEMETQGSDPLLLQELAPLALAEHWQDVQSFLALLHDAWPPVLEAEGAANPAARRSESLRNLAQRLEAAPLSGMV